MDVMQTVEDSFLFLSDLGMQKQVEEPRTLYHYPSLPQKGRIRVLGDIEKYYFIDLDYHIIKEVAQPYQMVEPYVEIALLKEAQNFISRDEENREAQDLPMGISFSVVRPTGAMSCMFCGHDTYCRGVSFILRHKSCVDTLYPVIEKLYGCDVDSYSIIQMAGTQCLPLFQEILTGLKNCCYNGTAAKMYLEAKAGELLAALTHSIENLGSQAIPRYTGYEKLAVFDIQKILKKAIKKPPTLRALARQTGINPNKMQAVFRYYTGVTIMDYLRNYRMQRALQLLAGDLLLDEIAHEVGYRSASRFSEAFVKAYGILPSKYRKMQRSQSAAP